MTEIENAIKEVDLPKVKRLLEESPSLIDEKDDNGTLMALLAAKTGDLSLVRYIVEYSRASMNIYDDHHRGMLHFAAMSGNVDTCRYLVERVGLSPVEGDLDLETPYEIAHRLGFKELESYFENEVGAPLPRMYHNPIRTGMYPDPSIVRVNDTYYMVNSSFIFFPCIPISESKDLIHWRIIGHAITNPAWAGLDDLSGGRGYWASDISYFKGKFYITATYRLNDTGTVYRKQIVVSSEKPEGPYSKPAIIDEDGIDPSIFNDDDGRRYMLLNRGARIFEINEDATKQIGKARLLYYGDHKRAPEGPHLLKKDGYYYLFEAEGGTGDGHRITVSRSRTLFGRYEPCPYNPIMRQNDESAMIQRCGHGKPVETQNGEWYMVYLCGRKLNGSWSILGRETCLDPIRWTEDGWPVVNELNGPSALQIKPDLPEKIWDDSDENDFNGDRLAPCFMSARPPEKDGITLTGHSVLIKGSRYDLTSIKAKNMLLRRQQDFNFAAICRMKVPDLIPGQDAGMTCYYDENTFLKFGIFDVEGGDPDKLVLKVVEVIGDTVRESKAVEINEIGDISSDGCIWLKVVTDGLRRTFLAGICEDELTEITSLDNVYYLSDEGYNKGKRFTGACVGLYSHAGDKTGFFAEFDTFRYGTG